MAVKISAFEKDGKSFSYMELKPIGQEKFGFFFDLSQAKLILNNMEEIQKFVEDTCDFKPGEDKYTYPVAKTLPPVDE